MTQSSSALAESANRGTESCFGENRTERRFIYELMQKARALWPRKTASELSLRTSVSQRAAEFWLACQHDLSLGAARKLIQSDKGFEFLTVFMGDAKPDWWLNVKEGHEIAVLRSHMADHQSRLEQFELSFGKRLQR
jgi:hypothetical protein